MPTYISLPVIDLNLAASFVGDDKEEAEKLFKFFLQSLSVTQGILDNLYKKEDWKGFEYEVEKLLSGACYCGVPRFEAANRELLEILGSDPTQVNKYYCRLVDEMKELERLGKEYFATFTSPANNSSPFKI